jgi:hypothetical protein
MDLNEILYGGDDRWVQLLNRLVDLDEILYGGEGIEYCFL